MTESPVHYETRCCAGRTPGDLARVWQSASDSERQAFIVDHFADLFDVIESCSKLRKLPPEWQFLPCTGIAPVGSN